MMLKVKAFPNSGREEVVEREGVLRVYLRQPAEGGKANREIITVLAKRFGVHESQVRIRSDVNSRNKLVFIENR